MRSRKLTHIVSMSASNSSFEDLIKCFQELKANGVAEQLGKLGARLESISSKSDQEIGKLESKLADLEVRLRESENTCTAQNIRIGNLETRLTAAETTTHALENWKHYLWGAIAVLGAAYLLLLYLLRDFISIGKPPV